MATDRCRSCPAPIVWVTSATSGKPIPCDPEPVEIVEVTALAVESGRRFGKTQAQREGAWVSGVNDDGAIVSGVRVDSDLGRHALESAQRMATSLFGEHGTAPTVKVRISHFATCPNRDRHRGKGRT